jgi:hypothetical protein
MTTAAKIEKFLFAYLTGRRSCKLPFWSVIVESFLFTITDAEPKGYFATESDTFPVIT